MADDDLELKVGRIGDAGGAVCKATAQKHFAWPAVQVHAPYANTVLSSQVPSVAEPALACAPLPG